MTKHTASWRPVLAFVARGGLTFIILSAPFWGGGCTTPRPTRITDEQTVPPLVMTLMPGDEIELRFFGAPELNSTQAIRRDGRISLQLVGEVTAAGKKPDALEEELRDLYASELQIKDVSLVLRVPPPVLVSGSVLSPGRVRLERPMTVLDIVMESGGFVFPDAEVRSVVLIRHVDGRREAYRFDFRDALSGQGRGRPFYVEPFDIVYVPRTRITRVNAWVEQHINRMIPRLGLSYGTDGEMRFYR